MINKYCVYKHIKPNGEVFYIGMGNKKRPYTFSDRSDFWKKITSKYDYKIIIIKNNISKNEAYKLERMLISKYGRRDLGKGTLVNHTDGGDGSYNVVISEETRLKISIANTGSKRSNETKKKMSEAAKGRVFTAETRLKMSNSAKNKTMTEEHKNKLWFSRFGAENGMYKRTHSEETKEKIRQKAIGRKMPYNQRIAMCKKIVDTKTGIIYNSIDDVLKLYLFSKRSIRNQLNGSQKNKTTLKYL